MAIALALHSTTQRYLRYITLTILLVGGTFTLSHANDTLVISVKSKHVTQKLSKCNHPYTFLSDTLSTTYRDRSPRNAIYTICPRYPQQRIGVDFQRFDLAIGDTLFAYNGYNIEAPLLGFATGQGVEAAFGGKLFGSYSRILNPTSCITFKFHTNGDEIAGEGWEAIVQCLERDLEIIIPNIPSQQFTCDPSYSLVQIPPAEVISASGPIPNDSTIVLIRDGNTGEICGESRSSFQANTVLSNIFGPGTYVIEYISLLDNSVRGTTRFEVSPPPLVCKESVVLKIGNNFQLPIDLNQLIENYCPPQHDLFQYNVIVRDLAGNFVTHGNTLEGLPNFPLDQMTACSNEPYFVEIQKEYGNMENVLACNSERLVQTCIVEIKLEDQEVPSFIDPAKTYTLMACEYDLLQVISTLPIPTIENACGQATVQIESASVLEDAIDCNDASSFLITWNAIDARGNSIKRFDTLKIVRPTIIEMPVEDITIYCPSNRPTPSASNNRPALLSGITINGEFQLIDTLFLSTSETVCDYQLLLNETTRAGNCGNDVIRYWSMVDQCTTPSINIPLDTQIIQIIDTLAPTISCTDATSLGTAQVFALPVNNCQVIPNLPLPTATDDCDDKPIVKEFNFETLANGEWSQMAIPLFQTSLGVGTYRVNYVATDACGNASNNATCYHYFSIEDTVEPIANCQQNISIQLDANGTTTLSAATLNNGSSDNCGIADLLIRKSDCTSNDFQMTNAEYASSIALNCCDLTNNIQLELLVVDNAGNTSTCSTIIDPLTTGGNPSGADFVEAPQTYTLTACDFDLLETIAMLPQPAVANACGQSLAQIESATILNNTTECGMPSAFLITWQSTDDFGNTIRRFDTLNIERPEVLPVLPSPDITAGCEDNLSPTDASFTPPSLITSLEINGQVQLLETIQLSITETVCDYQISFEDVVISGNEVNRIWSLTDLCATPATSTPIDTQKIQNIDNVPPTIACTDFSNLDNLETIPLSDNDCSASLDFPLPTAVDNCDNSPIVRESGVENLVNGVWSPIGMSLAQLTLGQGIYRVVYEAIDASGNRTNCYHYFSLQDTTPPVAVCQQSLSIQLDASGQATLNASDLNNNSFDNCGIDQILIKRNTCRIDVDGDGDQRMEVQTDSITGFNLLDWSTSISFDCCDLTNPVLVELLVTDNAGNATSCQTIVNQVNIDKASAFQFVDPPQIYTLLACDFDLLRTVASLPIPAVTNACGTSSAQIESTTILNNNTQCNNQSDFIITWQATDNFGNTIRRFDTLNIERPMVIPGLPSSDISTMCGGNISPTDSSFTPPSLITSLEINGQIQIIDTLFLSLTETVCDYQLSYEDVTIAGNEISRVWSLIDLCTNPATSMPIDTQIIQNIDNIAPTIVCTNFSSLDNAERLVLPTNSCSSTLNFPLPTAVDNCDNNPRVREVAVETLANGVWSPIGTVLAQIMVGPGSYRVAYEAIDANGNTSTPGSCYHYFSLQDTTPPVANCPPSISIQLDASGQATYNAADLNNNSFDNCGIDLLLVKRASTSGDGSPSISFDCSDLTNTVVLELVVVDEAGNTTTCQSTVTQVTIDSPSSFEFARPAQTYTLIACNFDLLETVAILPIPAVTNACGTSSAQIESTTILANNTNCNNQSDFLITWQATDNAGNTIRRFDTLKIERPSALQMSPSQDITIRCEDNTSTFATNPPSLLTGIIIDGQFTVFDTLFLSVTEAVCDFQLGFDDFSPIPNCRDQINRVWSITDLCVMPSMKTPIDTQEIRLIDNTPPTIICSEFASLADAELLFLSASNCEEIINLPLPSATDNCDTSPTIREVTVDLLLNQTWSSLGTTLSQTPLVPGIYRVGYEAIDDCGTTARSAICFRYFTLEDSIPPIANCHQNIAIQLDENGLATLSAEEVNNNSSDNCGIVSQFIRRSDCGENNPTMSESPSNNPNDYSASVQFDCCDVAGTIRVDLLVTDITGNSSTCSTIIEQLSIKDNGRLEFVEPTKTYTLIACDFDLLPTIATLPVPGTTDVCGQSAAQIEATALVSSNAQCNNQSDFVITWIARDDFGNAIRRFDTLRIERPTALQITPSTDISIPCDGMPIDSTRFSFTPPSLLTGLVIDGQFQIFDSIFLSPNETVCDFQLSFELDNATSNCGDTVRGIWSVTDLCLDPSLSMPIDTQEIILMNDGSSIANCSCTTLAPATATCKEYEITDLGRPTDINENGEFDDAEWLTLRPFQVDLFDAQFGNTISACTNNAICQVPIIEQQYQLIEGSCGSIAIKRRYRGIDSSGNRSPWLEQAITINYQPDWMLVFPADAMTNCDVGKIEDPRSPIQNGVCDDLVWNFRDSIVSFENGSIKEICRTFNIVNRCFGNMDDQWLAIPRPTNDQGVVSTSVIVKAADFANEDHLTYTQKIRFVDNEAPFIVIGDVDLNILGKGDVAPFGEEDQTLGEAPFECDEIKEFSVFARDCNEPSTASLAYNWEFSIEDQRIATGEGPSFLQAVIPNTLYMINWSVRDEFGNQTDTTISYEFVDAGPPTTLCKKGIQATIDSESRDVTITVDSLNAGSFDNCDDQLQIGLFMWHESVMPDTPSTLETILQLPDEIAFSCLDTGEVELLLYSTDQGGNFSFCSTTVEITDNPDVDCDETMLNGMITNRFGHPISGVGIPIIGEGSTMEAESNQEGQYDQMLPMEDTYTIHPVLDKHPLNGVSTYDIILISKHILGEQIFESPYQYIAADVNRSGSISVFDIVQLRQLILNQIHEFPNNESWQFINADFEFLTDQPLAEVFPEHYEYAATTPEHLNMDFVGVKIGDLNGNADTYNLNTNTVQSRQSGTTFYIQLNPIEVQKGKTYTLPFYAPSLKEIAGFQATFKFHDLILTNFEEGVVTSENVHGWRKNQEGFLTTSWHSLLSHDNNSSKLFTLTVKATKDGNLQELLEVTSNPTPVEAYSLSGNRLGVALSYPEKTNKDLMNFGFASTPLPHAEGMGVPTPSVSGVFQLFQNHPNPFSKTTTISFYLPEAAMTALSLFDVHGQNILQTQQHYETGTHTITLNSDQMPIGTYFYQVATPFGVATKKMTIIH